MITFKQHRYLIFALFTFGGIILYELNINPIHLFDQLYAEVRPFAVLIKNDEVVLLNQKTKFKINDSTDKQEFIYMDYDTGMLNGNIDITEIKTITIIQGNRSRQIGQSGFMTGFIGGFLLPFLDYGDIGIGLICGSISGASLGATGTAIGHLIPKIKTYSIGENEWQFVNMNDIISN